MEQRGTCIVPMVKAPKIEGRVRLTAMHLKKNHNKKRLKFLATITSLKEDNGAKKSLSPGMKKLPRENNVVMPKKPPRHLPSRKEVDREAEIQDIKKQLKKLHEGIDRVNGLLVARTRRQDSIGR